MIEISIDDEIGFWGISAAYVSDKLQGIVDGEEIKLSINSPGGSVIQSIAIFNIVRAHARNHPVSVYITGVAASGASYIALAARTVTPESKVYVSDNSIFVIHNPYIFIEGDYKKLLKEAEWLKRLAYVLASTYAAVSKQKQENIQTAMDNETFYIGQEIVDAGFANHFEKIGPGENIDPQSKREALIVNAKTAIQNVKVKIAEKEPPIDADAAALLQNTLMIEADRGAGSRENNSEAAGTLPSANCNNLSKPDGKESPAGKGDSMNEEELKAKYPDVYAVIFAKGKEAGVKAERERTAAHLKLGETSGSLETAAKYIRDGASVTSEEVQSEYLSLRMGQQALAARAEDNPGSVTPGEEEAEDDIKAMAIFDAAYAGKEYKGGKK
jgi:ATP-dependent protease ClpP protease subunit